MIALNPHDCPALARGVRLKDDPITGDPILLFPEGILPLDDATHDIISRCSGEMTVESMVLSLADEYDIDADTLRRDVCECLEQLRERMLVAVSK
jgi:coenzyme PQQ biosynthesis protein PqqD